MVSVGCVGSVGSFRYYYFFFPSVFIFVFFTKKKSVLIFPILIKTHPTLYIYTHPLHLWFFSPKLFCGKSQN